MQLILGCLLIAVTAAQLPTPAPTNPRDVEGWKLHWVSAGKYSMTKFMELLGSKNWTLKDEDAITGVKVFEQEYVDNDFQGKFSGIIHKVEFEVDAPVGPIFVDFHFGVECMGEWSPVMKPGETLVLQDLSKNDTRIFWQRVYPQAPLPLPPRTFLMCERTIRSKDGKGRTMYLKAGMDVEFPGRLPPSVEEGEKRANQGPSGLFLRAHPTKPKTSIVTSIVNMNYQNPVFEPELRDLYKRFNYILIMSAFKDQLEERIRKNTPIRPFKECAAKKPPGF